MKIFIRKIPEDTKSSELERLLMPFLKKGLVYPFRANGKITRKSVIVQVDEQQNVIAHHGLVTVEPDIAAKRMLKRMHRTTIKGRRVIVREFNERSWQNDRRSHKFQKQSRIIKNQRYLERRLHALIPESNTRVSFSDQSNFSRKYG